MHVTPSVEVKKGERDSVAMLTVVAEPITDASTAGLVHIVAQLEPHAAKMRTSACWLMAFSMMRMCSLEGTFGFVAAASVLCCAAPGVLGAARAARWARPFATFTWLFAGMGFAAVLMLALMGTPYLAERAVASCDRHQGTHVPFSLGVGTDGHGQAPQHLLGADGHGQAPRVPFLLGLAAASQPALLGADGHGQAPQHLLGADGHGQAPQHLLGADGHGQAPQHLLGADGHGQRLPAKDGLQMLHHSSTAGKVRRKLGDVALHIGFAVAARTHPAAAEVTAVVPDDRAPDPVSEYYPDCAKLGPMVAAVAPALFFFAMLVEGGLFLSAMHTARHATLLVLEARRLGVNGV